jgi:hypothetical protein
MPAIIYQKTPGELFATGERTVSIFPSGLVRVEQTFICPKTDAATHRAALAVGSDMPGGSTPAIDGLYIYPAPQEKIRSDGFTEFIVSAYGRTNTTGTETLEWNVFSLSGTDSAKNIQVTGIYKNRTKRVQLVLNESQLGTLSFDESLATTPVLIDGFNILNIRWTRGVASYQSTNFGVFTEVTYSIGAYKLVEYGQS